MMSRVKGMLLLLVVLTGVAAGQNTRQALSKTESKSGGNFFAVAFVRILINKIFVEPKLYFAAKRNDAVGSHPFVVNPSGFSVTLGFQQ